MSGTFVPGMGDFVIPPTHPTATDEFKKWAEIEDETPIRFGYTKPMAEMDLRNIERAAEERNFAHPLDTLRLIAEIRRLKAAVPTEPDPEADHVVGG